MITASCYERDAFLFSVFWVVGEQQRFPAALAMKRRRSVNLPLRKLSALLFPACRQCITSQFRYRKENTGSTGKIKNIQSLKTI